MPSSSPSLGRSPLLQQQAMEYLIVLTAEVDRLELLLRKAIADDAIEQKERYTRELAQAKRQRHAYAKLVGYSDEQPFTSRDLASAEKALAFRVAEQEAPPVLPGQVEAEVISTALPQTKYSREEYELEDRLRTDFVFFALQLQITYRPGINKDHPHGGFGPFRLNSAQEKLAGLFIDQLYLQQQPLRVIILKSRQLGCTTFLLAFWLWMMMTHPHFNVMFLIDKDKHGLTKREEVLRWVRGLEEKFSFLPTISKREPKVLFFSNGSKMFFESAESPNPGTSEMIHCLHESEKPKWPHGRAQQVEESVTPGLPLAPLTVHVDESTALGMDDFQKRWQRAVKQEGTQAAGMLLPIFLPWFVSTEYALPVPRDFEFANLDEELQDLTILEDGSESLLSEQDYAIRHNLTKEQVYWRRTKIKDSFKGNRAAFDQEFPTTPDHAWRSTQQSFFPRGVLERIRRYLADPVMVGRLEDRAGYTDFQHPIYYTRLVPRFSAVGVGELKVWEPPVPEKQYFIGVDVAEGKSTVSAQGELDTDYTVFSVEDDRGLQVAEWCSRVRPEEAWLPLLLVCMFYNQAWLNGERNGPGMVLLSYFIRTGYPNMLVHSKPEGRPIQDRMWTTVGAANRESILAALRAAVAEEPLRVQSQALLDELTSFVRKMHGGRVRIEAASGSHDDLVFAKAHATFCRTWLLGHEEREASFAPPVEEVTVPDDDKFRLGVNVDIDEEESWEHPW